MIYGACSIGGCHSKSIDWNIVLVIALGVIVFSLIVYYIIKTILKHKK